MVDNGALDHSHAWQAPMTLLLSLAYIATWPGVWSISSGGALDHATEGGKSQGPSPIGMVPMGGLRAHYDYIWLVMI